MFPWQRKIHHERVHLIHTIYMPFDVQTLIQVTPTAMYIGLITRDHESRYARNTRVVTSLYYWAFTRYDRRTDRSVRLVGRTIVSCKPVMFVFDRSDRRSEGSNMFDFVRLPIRLSKRVDTVGPTGQSDDQSRCSVGGTCCLRHSYIAAAVIYTSGG